MLLDVLFLTGLENKYYSGMVESRATLYLAEFLGLKLCSSSMACPGLFLPLLSPSIYQA